MDRIGVVVLNYKNYEETIQCVESILTQKEIEKQIVIVDNASGNDSCAVLKTKFESEKEVTIIANEKNWGYAKGNNIGIDYLRKRGIDFIIVCNSDVTFTTDRILYTMRAENRDAIGVMIPIIRNLDGTIEMRAQYKSRFFPLRILKELRKMQKKQGDNNVVEKDAILNKMKFLEPGIQNNYYVITGSVFALTPSFFKYYKGLYPETFLYVEELATMMMVYRAKLKCAIVQTDDVLHKGAASTEDSMKGWPQTKRKMVAESAKQVEKLVFLPSFLLKYKYGVRK